VKEIIIPTLILSQDLKNQLMVATKQLLSLTNLSLEVLSSSKLKNNRKTFSVVLRKPLMHSTKLRAKRNIIECSRASSRWCRIILIKAVLVKLLPSLKISGIVWLPNLMMLTLLRTNKSEIMTHKWVTL